MKHKSAFEELGEAISDLKMAINEALCQAINWITRTINKFIH